ncbi:MAG: M20/M25/M40 family metallo-hydrolase [Bacteroidales bacterium]|nr:M20/M25/M40 family metallo-hydrolase [Bacteroidales bacterium]
MKKILLVAALAFASFSMIAQDKVVQKVLELGKTDANKTMYYDDYISTRIGGRIVGSHNLEDAEKWVAKQFKEMGLEVELQEVGQINVGFSRDHWTGKMIGGTGMILDFGTPSYTAGTHGIERGHVVIEPTTEREFNAIKGKLKGAWVLIGGASNGMALDWSDKANQNRKELREKNADIERQNAEIRRYNQANPNSPKKLLDLETIQVPFYKEMCDAGVLGFIQSAVLPMQIHYDRANCYNITMDNLPNVCDIKLNKNQYETIKQMVQDKEDFQLEFDIRNHFFEGPVKYHNVIATLKGSKYPNEYVMMGGHLDAFDSATGSVDDANGVSLTMAVAKLLTDAGAKPKRSIKFCVWTGEEYGLLGSKFFVENKTVPLEKISNYFNRDGGPLAATAINVPATWYDEFVKICAPLENYDPEIPFKVNKREGESAARPTTAGGSDHAYFAMNGVPTVGFSETDPKGYGFVYRDIWHTTKDLLNMVYPDYMQFSTVVTAVTAYGVANLDKILTREGVYKD